MKILKNMETNLYNLKEKIYEERNLKFLGLMCHLKFSKIYLTKILLKLTSF